MGEVFDGRKCDALRHKLERNMKLCVKDMPVTERPRERLAAYGVRALSDAELLAIILRTGSQKQNVVDTARRLLLDFELNKMNRLTVSQLKKKHGIGQAKACQVLSALELGRRSYKVKLKQKKINTLKDVVKLLQPELKGKKQEHFIGLYLDARNNLITQKTLFVGSLDATMVHPREVFAPCLQEAAAKVIVAHNHPSGDPTPSQADVEVTKRLFDASQILGVELVDHVVIGEKRGVSLLG